MSTADSPSSETDPRRAREAFVTRGCMLFATEKVTSTLSPMKAMPVTAPTGTPAIRTCAPSFRPAMFVNTVFSEYRCQENPPEPLKAKTITAASTSATMVSRPIFSSDQASDRVRGIFGTSGQKSFQIRVRADGGAELPGIALEGDEALLEHDELRLFALLFGGRHDPDAVTVAHRLMRGHAEGIAHLVRDHDRADVLQVAQLDDLVVDSISRDRIEPRG